MSAASGGERVASPNPASGTRSPQPLAQRPVKVAIYGFDGFDDFADRQRDSWLDLRSFVTWLNEGQELFEFIPSEIELSPSVEDEDLHGFTAEGFYECLDRQLESLSDVECGIGLAYTPLERGEFNHHDERRGVGVITIEGYQQYIPEVGSLERYLAYLVLCEAFCLAGRRQYEHRKHRKCLFDLCRNKPELIDCLRQPHICANCRKELDESGFNPAEIADVEGFLGGLAKPIFGWSLASALRKPTPNMIAGAFVAVVAATYAATAKGWTEWLPAIVLGAVFLLLVLWQYLKGRLIWRTHGRPKSRWRGAVARPRRWVAKKLR